MSDGHSDYVRSIREDHKYKLRMYGPFAGVPVGLPRVPPKPESVKEIYWRLKAERLERELAARTSAPAYFWLGREAEAA